MECLKTNCKGKTNTQKLVEASFSWFILASNKNKPIASTAEIFGSFEELQLDLKNGNDFHLQF